MSHDMYMHMHMHMYMHMCMCMFNMHSQISTPGQDTREDGHATADTPGT